MSLCTILVGTTLLTIIARSTLLRHCCKRMLSPFLQALRRAAPSLSRHFFGCRQPIQLSTRAIPRGVSLRAQKQIGPFLGRSRRFSAISSTEASSPVADKLKSTSRFPDSSTNTVAYWLLGSAASVFGIVVFGGLTRLTESGYVANRPYFYRLRC